MYTEFLNLIFLEDNFTKIPYHNMRSRDCLLFCYDTFFVFYINPYFDEFDLPFCLSFPFSFLMTYFFSKFFFFLRHPPFKKIFFFVPHFKKFFFSSLSFKKNFFHHSLKKKYFFWFYSFIPTLLFFKKNFLLSISISSL